MVVDDGDIEGQLPGVLVPELTDLQLDDDVADLLGVKQQQIDEALVAVDGEMDLAANERELGAKLGQGLLQPTGQGSLDRALTRSLGQVKEVEDVRILHNLLGLVGVDRL